ncbi:MAG: hypothetical protein ABIC96_04475 [Patescibacteria group bacterium]
MKKEYILVFIVGLFILAYVLDAVVNPLRLNLITPYHYFSPAIYTKYAFTSTSIVIKSIALLFTVLWLISFMKISRLLKGGILLGLSGLMQLYALQDVATGSQIIPLEWSLSFTLAGVLLLTPMIIYLIWGVIDLGHKKIQESLYGTETTPQEADSS